MMKMLSARKPLTFVAFLLIVACISYLVTHKIPYFSAPLDGTSHRRISITATSEIQATIPVHQAGDAIYHIDFVLLIAVDSRLLNANQSENICIDPQVTPELPANTRMSGDHLTNIYRIPEMLWSRAELKVDSRTVIGAVQAGHSGASTAVFQCFNISNLPTGRHTVALNTSLETGETFSPLWQILIEP